MPKKIAFLFLIYEDFNHEDVWNDFFRHADPEKYTILIHYKKQKQLSYFESYKMKYCIPTNYGDITLVKAHLYMIHEAFKDPLVCKTINLSQACIPFKSFEYVYEKLTKDDMSHFNRMPMSDWSLQVTTPATSYIPREDIYKAANWFILNREHANCCFTHLEYIQYFISVKSPEEFVFLTILKKYCNKDICLTEYSGEGATTFTNWDYKWGMKYKYPHDYGLKNYSNISDEELEYLIQSPCLFGRKFNKECTFGPSLRNVYCI
jgi:hypothetical protein